MIKQNRKAILLALFISIGVLATAQNAIPYNYWTFEGTNALSDSMNHNTLNTTTYQSPYNIAPSSTNTGIGKSLSLNSASRMIVASSPLALDSGITIEFLFKPGANLNETVQLFGRRDGAVQIRFTYPEIKFNTKVIPNGSTTAVADNFNIELENTGRGSYGYYVDGNWHHFVFKYNAKTGVKQVWVDGQLPSGFSTTIPAGKFATNTSNPNLNILDINTNTDYYKVYGNLDEIAIYQYDLHPNMVYKHYNEFLQKKHYSFNFTTVAPPSPAVITSGIDVYEYAPGHPAVTVSAVDQLKSFPSPRYKPGNTLFPNVPIINPAYIGGYMQPNVSYSTALANSKEIQKEFVKTFNYTLVVASNTHEVSTFGDTTRFAGAWIKMANQNPSWKTSAVSYWAQMNPQIKGYASADPYVKCGCLPDASYLRNAAGQFIDRNGNVITYKVISPETALDSIKQDGKVQKYFLEQLTSKMTRNLDVVLENGEVVTHWTPTGLALDPVVNAAKIASGLDWHDYSGNRMNRITAAYMNEFRNIPKLANTWTLHYQTTAHPSNWSWQETRTLNSLKNGMHYSTGDIYIRYPFAWKYGSGMAKGWEDLIDQRYEEITMGDKLFSPVVSAGWSNNEESTLRPAQYLGFLKAVGMTGAENFQAGYFVTAQPYQLPQDYVWQFSIPGYAQALTSRYEDLLRNGYLMNGDVPARMTGATGLPGYSFFAGDVRKLVTARKHNTLSKYVITGTIQPNSNQAGNVETEGVASINLDGQTVTFKIRRQGSTYIYDKTNASSPVFYQIDSWHENTHPSYWSKTFDLEAEVYDNTPANVEIKTQVPSGAVAGDYSSYTSYISFNAASTVDYYITPRGNTTATHYVWVLARSKDGSNSGFTVSLDGTTSNSINCITDQNWKWYRFDATTGNPIAYSNLSLVQHKISVSSLNNKLEIDRITITPQNGAYYANGAAPCIGSAATAVISPSGVTTFCQGGSVNLTANSGTAYLWSNGATTQSVSVNSTGTYTVTVSNGAASAVSSPVSVTVNPIPSANINASGPLTFCIGSSVNLTASTANATYLWTPGNATTQTITVNTSGTYNVKVTNASGCSATSNAVSVSASASSVQSTVTANGATSFCEGGSVALTANSGTAYLWSNGATTQTINASTSGNYSVTVTTSGCASTPSNPITVTSKPRATFNVTTSGPLSFCQGGSVTLNVNQSTGNSYVWYKDNKVISGVPSSAMSYTATTAGKYMVRVQLGSCGKFSSIYTVTIPCRINELLSSSTFDASVYPNPFNERTTIAINLIEAAKVSVYIYDIEGRIVDILANDELLDEGVTELEYNTPHLRKGIYFAVINSGTESKRIKISSLE